MRQIPFIKMHGIGNDFVIIDERQQNYSIDTALVQLISDRHKGVGCDQFVVLRNSDLADCHVIFYNSDGSISGACGNATRCVAKLISNENSSNEVNLQTEFGILNCSISGENISVNMGAAKTNWNEIPLRNEVDTDDLQLLQGELQGGFAVSMGNPHAVFFVEDTNAINLAEHGSALENHEIFPERANIEIVQVLSESEINLRVWERGAGETLACGSGACAAVYASYKKGLTGDNVKVNLPGGALQIKVNSDGSIIMTGTATHVFEGVLEL